MAVMIDDYCKTIYFNKVNDSLDVDWLCAFYI